MSQRKGTKLDKSVLKTLHVPLPVETLERIAERATKEERTIVNMARVLINRGLSEGEK